MVRRCGRETQFAVRRSGSLVTPSCYGLFLMELQVWDGEGEERGNNYPLALPRYKGFRSTSAL